MNSHHFDELARSLAHSRSRRQILSGATRAAFGGALTMLGLHRVTVAACVGTGEPCTSDGECCSSICRDATCVGDPEEVGEPGDSTPVSEIQEPSESSIDESRLEATSQAENVPISQDHDDQHSGQSAEVEEKIAASVSTEDKPTESNAPAATGPISSAETGVSLIDQDFQVDSLVTDCAGGWGLEEWELVLSQARIVTFEITDCCLTGDYYELWVDGAMVGVTPVVSYLGPLHSAGSFEVPMQAGTHQVKVRDAAFDTFIPDVLADMCPAGFTLTWTLGSGVDCPVGQVECNGTCAHYSVNSVSPTSSVISELPLRIKVTAIDESPISGALLIGGGLPVAGLVTDMNGEVALSYGFPMPAATSSTISQSFHRVNCGSHVKFVLSFQYQVEVSALGPVTLTKRDAVFFYNLQRLFGIDPATGVLSPKAILEGIAGAASKSIGAFLSVLGVIEAAREYAAQVGDVVHQEWRTYTSPAIDTPDYEFTVRVTRAENTVYSGSLWTKDKTRLPTPPQVV